MIEWINFICLILGVVLFCYFYTISLQPKKRSKTKGEQAWKQASLHRTIAGFFEFTIVITMVLWIWFPIPQLNWKIHPNFLIGFVIGVIITIFGLILMIKGMIDAGSETIRPSETTEMYGGIYNYIRHPQTLGEFPIFIAVAFMVNSWFLVIIMILFNIIYIPIMIHYEEEDLIRRFGEEYRRYQKSTGALFPKLRKRSEQND